MGFDRVRLPRVAAHLSAESLSSDGAFLLYDGIETSLWLGRAVPPGLIEALFGVQSLDGIDPAYVSCSCLPQLSASPILTAVPCV